MPCGWEGNRRSGVALAMRHRLMWFKVVTLEQRRYIERRTREISRTSGRRSSTPTVSFDWQSRTSY